MIQIYLSIGMNAGSIIVLDFVSKISIFFSFPFLLCTARPYICKSPGLQ